MTNPFDKIRQTMQFAYSAMYPKYKFNKYQIIHWMSNNNYNSTKCYIIIMIKMEDITHQYLVIKDNG